MPHRAARGVFPLLVAVACFGLSSAADPGSIGPPPPPPESEMDYPVPTGWAGSEELDYDPLLDEEFDAAPEVYDPFETGNRRIYRFNQSVDRWVWRPVTTGYRFVVPEPARRSVRRVFDNLNMPVYVVNHVLQLHFGAAIETLGAFTMNMTFGMGGIFDTGKGVGLQLRPADFGQTLALVGVGSGPYLMFPVLGPTTLRDGLGSVIDRAFHPLTYFLPISTQLMWGGGFGVAQREAAADELRALEESSLDPYAVLRSAYAQARAQSIEELRGSDGDSDPPLEAAGL